MRIGTSCRLRAPVFLCCVIFCVWAGPSASAQQSHQASATQDPKQIVEQAVRTELAADAADHSLWLYYDVDRKPHDGVVQWAAQTHMGEVDRLLQQDGRQLTPEEQRSKMDEFIHDPAAQAKQRRGGQHDDKQAAEMLETLPKAFVWTLASHEGKSTFLHFKPDPSFRAPTRESRVFAAMEGDMQVDDAEHRIVSLKGKLVSEVKFGWGVLGELEPGGTFDVERRSTGPGIWQITETHVHIQGHALFFHTIADQEDDVKSKFEQLPDNITLEQAEQKLMKEGN
jgi:hypothetical protein